MADSIRAAVKLIADFNQGMASADALRRCHALDDQGLYWSEESTVYNNLADYAELARELATPVQPRENFYGPRELARPIDLRGRDYVMPDRMRIGGVSGWLRAVPIAAVARIEVSRHLYPGVSAHLMRSPRRRIGSSGRIGRAVPDGDLKESEYTQLPLYAVAPITSEASHTARPH